MPLPVPTSGFDVQVEVDVDAVNRLLEAFFAIFLATGQTKITQVLPSFPAFGTSFGTLTLELVSGRIAAPPSAPPGTAPLRPVPGDHGAAADLQLVGNLQLTGLQLLGQTAQTISGDVLLSFADLDVNLTTDPNNIPADLVVQLAGSKLTDITPSPALQQSFSGAFPQVPGLGAALFFLFQLVLDAVKVGFGLAASLVGSISLTIKQAVDAFAKFGLSFHHPAGLPAQDSPFVTVVGPPARTGLLVAGDFQRSTPPPAGNPALFADFLTAPDNVGAVLGQAGVNQMIDAAFLKGLIPSGFRAGGWEFYIWTHEVSFLGPASAPGHTNPNPPQQPLGAIRIDTAVTGRHSLGCFGGLHVLIVLQVDAWPVMDAQPPAGPGAQQSSAIIRADLAAAGQVRVSGFIVQLAVIILGPLLLVVLPLLSQVANAIVNSLLPFTYTMGGTGNQVSLTVSSASVNAYVTMGLDLGASITAGGELTMEITEFTKFELPDPATFAALPPATQTQARIFATYDTDSVIVADGAILLQAELS